MTNIDVSALLTDRWVLLGAGMLALLVLAWIAGRIKRFARSPLSRIASVLANLFMVIGLGWSSEAIWEITHNKLKLPLLLVLLLFLVFEIALVLSMIRAAEHRKVYGWPGRPGRTTWIIASIMSVVAASAADSFAEVLIRGAIPLVVALLWWDGLVAGATKRSAGSSSWRWTPRRLLLWLGAIEPGERDVEQVHRERLTQTMTRLEFLRRHGSDARKKRAALKLSRLSLTADDAIVAEVRDRVDRSQWFKETAPQTSQTAPHPAVPAGRAALAKVRRVRHRSLLRKVCLAHPRPVIVAAPEPRQDERTAQDVDLVVRAIQELRPAPSQRRIAFLAALPPTTTRNSLRRIKEAGVAQPEVVNGRVPDLDEVSS